MVGEREGSIWRGAAATQAVLVAVALFALAFTPPLQGRTLLVPLSGRPVPAALLNNLTLRPLARGPLPGSVVVEGQGRKIAGGLLRQGILMLAAPSAICGMPKGHEGMIA